MAGYQEFMKKLDFIISFGIHILCNIYLKFSVYVI